jgi:hypothetical protein
VNDHEARVTFPGAAPAGAILLEFDTSATVAMQRGDLSARLDLPRVALLGVIPPPQELGSRSTGPASTFAKLFKEAEHESAKSSSQEHFGATVTKGFRQEGRPSDEDLSPALQGGRQILEGLRLVANVRSVPSADSDQSDFPAAWGRYPDKDQFHSQSKSRELPSNRTGPSLMDPVEIRAPESTESDENRQISRLVEGVKAQSGAWEGDCSISGADLAVTTSELQLLISIATPLYNALYATGTVKPAVEKKKRESGPGFAEEEEYWHHLQDLADGGPVSFVFRDCLKFEQNYVPTPLKKNVESFDTISVVIAVIF